LCPRRAPLGDTYKRIVASNDVGLLEDKNTLDDGKFEEIDLAEWVQSSPRYPLSKDFCLGSRNNDYQAQLGISAMPFIPSVVDALAARALNILVLPAGGIGDG